MKPDSGIPQHAGDGRPHVLITAGPTAEDIDPVRYITNRSSGRMGLELARAVMRAGGTPRLILGPGSVSPDPGLEVVRVRSADDMLQAVLSGLDWADSLVMAAAVADYTPAETLSKKLKKSDGDLVLRLKRTTDILAAVKDRPERAGKFIVGFSLDVGMNLAEGRRKLLTKRLDLIVANTVSSFGAGNAVAWLLTTRGETELGVVTKEVLAKAVVSRILDRFRSDQKRNNSERT